MRAGSTTVGPALAGICCLATITEPAAGVALHVPSEYATINAALDASAFGDTVLIAPGVYSDVDTRDIGLGAPFTACAFLRDGVVLRSSGGPSVTTIDMMQTTGLQPVVVLAFFLPSEETSAEGFTIKGETALHGVATSFGGRVTFRECVFSDLDAGPSTGGGIAANTDLRLIDCEFINCAANAGGGLYHSGGYLEMIGTVFRNCRDKAAFLVGDPPDVESAWIEGCTFIDNYSDNNSGAIHINTYDGGATVIGCHFEGNTAEDKAGALGWGNAGEKTIEGCTFVNNGVVAPFSEGGAISINGTGACTIRGNTFYANYQVDATFGGSTLEILTPTTFENNIVSWSSGGNAIRSTVVLSAGCNVYWANSHGAGVPLAETDREVDPEFCDAANGDFTVRVSSPCVEPNSKGCGQIGAFAAGCGAVTIDALSWGRIKGFYRGGRER